MADDKDEGAIVKAGPVTITDRFMAYFFPKRYIERQVTTGLGQRINAKLRAGEPLTSAERALTDLCLSADEWRAENLLTVLSIADREIKAFEQRQLPAGVDPPQLSAGEGAGRDDAVEVEPLETSAQWKSRLFREAEDASEDAVRDLYGRVLASEYTKPGSVSLRTLSVLRDIDRRTAETFQKFMAFAVNSTVVPFFEGYDRHGLELAAGMRAIMELQARRGLRFGDVMDMQDVGLFSAQASISISPRNLATQPEIRNQVVIGDRELVLRTRYNDDGTRGEFDLEGMALTVAGDELAKIARLAHDDEAFRCCALWVIGRRRQHLQPGVELRVSYRPLGGTAEELPYEVEGTVESAADAASGVG